jgi:CBS domain-containing protein
MKGHARNLMTERVTAVAPDTPVAAIAHTLVGEEIGGVPVVEAGGKIVGFVSDGDVMRALLRDPQGRTPASAVMSRQLVTIDEFATTDEVVDTLREHHVHHLPVVRGGRLVGIIAPKDVLRFLVDHGVPQLPDAG